MRIPIAISLPLLAIASPFEESAPLTKRQQPAVNATIEYPAQCKTCPWQLCPNVVPTSQDQVVSATCWTEGEQVADTRLWLKTTDECYLSEYDLIEYDGDYRDEIEYCGRVPLNITRQGAEIRYLSVCSWEADIQTEAIKHYGRDVDVTLTCWVEGDREVNGYPLWYKTTDNCYVSGAGIWGRPELEGFDNCGPGPGPRTNESGEFDPEDATPPTTLEELHQRDGAGESSLGKRWLQPDVIGEEYANCYTCPSATVNSTCKLQKVYEFDDRVVTQCTSEEIIWHPDGSYSSYHWMLLTDWCYVYIRDLWEPKWDARDYPRCNEWDGYQ